MERSIGFLLVASLMVAALVPALLVAEPTRAMGAEVTGIGLDGLTGPAGEYAAAEHIVTAQINNIGDVEYLNYVDFALNVTYAGNGTVFYANETIHKLVFLNVGDSTSVSLVGLTFPEDTFNMELSAVIEGVPNTVSASAVVQNVVDLSIMNDFFADEGHYKMTQELFPTCQVSYLGNIEDWKDQVNIGLKIHLLGDPMLTIYDEEMLIMDNSSSPVDPGNVFNTVFPPWTATEPGNYMAEFIVNYDTYNLTNNKDTVYLTIDEPPSIEGWVTTEELTPIPDVQVALLGTFLSDETVTDAAGYYSFYSLSSGIYTLEFTKLWLMSNTTTTDLISGETKVVNATLVKLNVGGLNGKVTLPSGLPAQGAQVVVDIPGAAPEVKETNSTGHYVFESLKAGSATVTASMEGYQDAVVSDVIIIEQVWNTLDLELGEIPFTVEFSPPEGEIGFPIVDSVVLTFSRPIDRETVTNETVMLKIADTFEDVAVLRSFDDNDRKVVLTPESPLLYNTDYLVVVMTNVTDINGNNFPYIAYSNFTTELEIIEITVSQVFPEDNANEVPIGTLIWARFPEAMDSDTINTTTFKVYAPGAVLVAGNVIYYPNNYTALFNPLSDLDYATRYSVALENEITPLDPSKVFMGKTWSFETKERVLTGTIAGYIYDENGKPFTPSKVTITLQKGTTQVDASVNAVGRFEVHDLASGTWTLMVKVKDYKEYSKQITLAAGQTYNNGAVKLEKSDEGNNYTWIAIAGIIILVLIVVVVILYLVFSRKEEEESGLARRPSFGTRRAEPYGAGYEPSYPVGGEFMCPVCGNVVEAEDATCPSCGSEFETDLFECPECGAMIAADAEQCPECGAKYEPEEVEGEEEMPPEEEPEPDISGEYEVHDLDDEDIPLGSPEQQG